MASIAPPARDWPWPTPSRADRTRRILVVEDDTDLSTIVVRIAGALDSDIEVDWARSAEQAADLLRSTPYDLVLADHFLAGPVLGAKLVSECSRLYPDTTLAMMSALPLREFVQLAERELPSNVQLLPKPFSAVDLRAFLHAVLDPARCER